MECILCNRKNNYQLKVLFSSHAVHVMHVIVQSDVYVLKRTNIVTE